MAIPALQMAYVGAYVLRQHLARRKRYPLVLMLEPLFRCNLACAGCGKIDYPDPILNQRLSYEDCMAAIDECGAPMVSIAGGEPLLHRDMPRIVEGFVAKKKYVILCTNALLLKQRLAELKDRHASVIAEVRGEGLLIGLRMIPQASEMIDELRAEKMIAVGAGDNVVRLLPPLIIGEKEIAEAVGCIDRACTRLEQTHARAAKAAS